MLTKALEEILKKLIDRLTTSRHGWVGLLFIALIVGAYFGLKEYRSSPDWAATLIDPLFATTLWFVGASAVIYIVWQLLHNLRRRLLSSLIVATIAFAGWWHTVELQPKALRIDVVLDVDALPDVGGVANFLATVQQKQIVVSLLSRPIAGLPLHDPIDFEHVKAAISSSVRPMPVTTHTAFVTARPLSGAGWSNLFYVTSPRLSAISTFGILPTEQREREVMLNKYLASMIPLAALHGQAQAKGQTMLQDRDPSTEHGCLHDFSVNKAVMMEKLRRGPKMCAIEEAEIASIFGKELVNEYRLILKVAAAASAR